MAIRYPEYVTIWVAELYDKFGNTKVANNPFPARARWEFAVREIADSEGTPIIVDVEMFTKARGIPMGSIVWRGRPSQLPDTPKPLYRVVGVESVYDLKGKKCNNAYLLSRYKGASPF